MYRLHDYLREWLSIAFRHSFVKADAVAGAVGVVFPAVAHAIGRPDVAASNLIWQIPLCLFAALFILRLVLAPFWLDQVRQAEIEKLKREIDRLHGELTKERALANYPVDDEQQYRDLDALMPALMAELRKDLQENPLLRKAVLLKKGWVFNSRGDFLAYYFEEHEQLKERFELLANRGLVMDISSGHTEKYRFTEEFVRFLKSGDEAK